MGLGAAYYCIGRELHGDGSYHFHAYGEWNSTFSSRDIRAFDIAEHHPNIQSVRSSRAVLGYCTKEDPDYLTNMSINGDRKTYRDVCMASNEREYWELVRAVDPRSFVLSHERLEYFARKFYKREREQHSEHRTFSVPRELLDWSFTNIQHPTPVRNGSGGPQSPPFQY